MATRTTTVAPKNKTAKSYKHPESESPMRPEVGTQSEFKKKLPPKKYRYDDSLSPVLEWDGQNAARERGEARIAKAEAELSEARKKLNGKPETKDAAAHVKAAQKAVTELKAMSKPFLNWSGKAERLSFDVPTLPLFIHERLSTKAILETLKGHKRDKQTDMFDLFGDPQHSITDQVLRAYEHKDKWVNRMILGDSLVVMNSLLHYENLGGHIQMIYIDPPYAVNFGSNFQPFVRKRDVKHNSDEDMTREPEMVQAYRDTWELRIHSYLTYLRDRLTLARELLSATGSIFVQIGDENQHHVRELLDEVFGAEHFCSVISVKKTSGLGATLLQRTQDFLIWYARDKSRVRFRQQYTDKSVAAGEDAHYVKDESGKLYTLSDLTAQNNNVQSCLYDFLFEGETFRLPQGRQWKTTEPGMRRLVEAGRVVNSGNSIRYKRYLDDFPVSQISDTWHDIGGSVQSRSDPKIYVVQTGTTVVQRAMLMTTDPGDLVLDPTCGSGTTAYVAEQWGRRWVTIDTSRVPLALARQRLLTATYPWYDLVDENRGPAAGLVYKPKTNKQGEHVGGIIPHVTLESFAKDEPAGQEVVSDRPEITTSITRVTGPFCVEATIPTPQDWEEAKSPSDLARTEADGSFVDRMIEILRKSPVLRLDGNRTVTLRNIRPPAKALALSAEAMVDATAAGQRPTLEDAVQEAAERNGKALPLSAKSVAFVFGPENGAVSEKLVYEAAREARAKNYTHLYVIGFAIQPNARELIEKCDSVVNIPATYVQATADLIMSDLLKNTRSSQVFSVCGMPEAELRRVKAKEKDGPTQYEVELLGMDVFDPTTLEVSHRKGDDVPAWLLDADYNGLCFHASQVFFPRTGAWENLKKALRGDYEETIWDHLAGTVSAPFEIGENGQVAIKVIDDRGNELLIVKPVKEAKK
jgi:adenine-specific DNA-methyltransferase